MNILEAIHYAQGDPNDARFVEHIQEVYRRLVQMCPFQIEYRILPLSSIALTGDLAKDMLESCDAILILVCTLGFAFERELNRMSVKDPAEALLWDACGSAYIEESLDRWEKDWKESIQPRYGTDRFSCGYGDLPLDLQPKLLRLVNARQRLGVHALPSHMLFPTKSVSALIGLSDRPQAAKIKGCASCLLKEHCVYRQKGQTCYERKSTDPRWSDGNDAPAIECSDSRDS